MLTGAALLACAFLVLGRPRSTQREKRDLMPVSPFSIVSTFHPSTKPYDSSFPDFNPTSPTDLNMGYSPLDLSNSDANLKTALLPDESPAVLKTPQNPQSKTFKTGPSSPIGSIGSPKLTQKSSTDSLALADQPDLTSESWKYSSVSTEIASAPLLIYKKTLEDLQKGTLQYCVWELLPGRSGFIPPECPSGTTSTLEEFQTVINDSNPGFGLWRRGPNIVLFRINVVHECESKHYDGRWYSDEVCQDGVGQVRNSIVLLYNHQLRYSLVEVFGIIQVDEEDETLV